MQEGLEQARNLLNSLTPEMLVPPGLLCPRYLKINFDDKNQVKTLLSKPETKQITDHLEESSILEFSPLSMIIKSSEVPQEEVKRASDA